MAKLLKLPVPSFLARIIKKRRRGAERGRRKPRIVPTKGRCRRGGIRVLPGLFGFIQPSSLNLPPSPPVRGAMTEIRQVASRLFEND